MEIWKGNLRGADQTINLVLEDCHERVYNPEGGVERVPLGLYIIRGDNVYEFNHKSMCVYNYYIF